MVQEVEGPLRFLIQDRGHGLDHGELLADEGGTGAGDGAGGIGALAGVGGRGGPDSNGFASALLILLSVAAEATCSGSPCWFRKALANQPIATATTKASAPPPITSGQFVVGGDEGR